MFYGRFGLPELLFLLTLLLICLPFLIVWVVGWWKIFSKTGYSGSLSFAMLIPFANLLIFLWFAFTQWPIERYERSSVSRSQGV